MDNDGEALDAFIPIIQKLSDLFTTRRPVDFPRYGDERSLQIAYGLFFFPQNLVRMQLVLTELLISRIWTPDTAKPLRMLDLGAGLGATGAGAAHHLLADPHLNLHWDARDHALASLRSLEAFHSAWPEDYRTRLHLTTRQQDLRKPLALEQSYDLIVLGFSLNEFMAAHDNPATLRWLTALGKNLTPDGLLIILEPAEESVARRLHQIADAITAEGLLFRHAPQRYQGPPPEQSPYWDHEVRRWTLPPETAHLNRHLWRNLSELKYSFTVLAPTPPDPLAEEHATTLRLRLVSPLAPLKGRLVFTGINDEGVRITVEIPTRGLNRTAIKPWLNIERGDTLRIKDANPLGNPGWYRCPGVQAIEHLYTLP